MAFEFKFPDVGEGIHEGEIVRWRVKVGDEVKEDQSLIEVETAKAIVELPSPKAGTILAVVGKEGEQIKVGATLVVIGEKNEKWDPTASVSAAAGATTPIKQASPGVIGEIPTEEKGVVLPSRTPEKSAATLAQTQILPRIRKLAQDLNVNLAQIKGTGPGGQVTEQDVQSAVAQTQSGGTKPGSAITQPNFAKWGPIEIIPMKSVRKAIAEHMVKSKSTIPHVTHMDEMDATALVALRASKKTEAEKKGIKLTYLPFVVKAVVETLKKHPALNAAFSDATGSDIIYKKYFNIGIAVDTEDGLMVPTIKSADTKDIFTIAQEIAELATKCRERKIGLEELQGGTFSITNIGSVGGIYATPIIAYGQTANLGVMRMKDKAVVVEAAACQKKIEIRPILTLALSYDHRVIDGAEAARFMNDLITAFSSPV